MSSPQTTDSPRVKLLSELARAFQTGDVALIAKHVHKDHRRTIYPRSLGRPELTGEEWLRNISEQMNLWTGDTELTFHSVIEAQEKIIAHVTHKAKTSIGVDMDREWILILTFVQDEDGILKMKDAEEFADSKTQLEFSKAVEEAKVKR